MRDLIETVISVLVALALIAATYHYLASWLVASVTASFDSLAH